MEKHGPMSPRTSHPAPPRRPLPALRLAARLSLLLSLLLLFAPSLARADVARSPPPCYRHDAGAACVVWGEKGMCKPRACQPEDEPWRGDDEEGPCHTCVLPPDPTLAEAEASPSDAGAVAPPPAALAKVPPGARGCTSAGDVAAPPSLPLFVILGAPVVAVVLLSVRRRRSRGRA
jgi:hypothetical protein